MSGYLQGQVWFRDVRGSEREILLALADHAADDGTRIYPSMEYLAWKVGLSKRRVQQVVSGLRDRGVLVVVAEATRYEPTHYRMDLVALPEKPDCPAGVKQIASLPARGETQGASGVQPELHPRGETQASPETSRETSLGNVKTSLSDVEQLWAHYQATRPHGERCKLGDAEKRMIRNALAVRDLETCKLAVTGLFRSDYHVRGGYTGLKYALVGGGRSPDPGTTIDRQAHMATNGNGNGTGLLKNQIWPDGRSWDELTPREQAHAKEAVSMGIRPWEERAEAVPVSGSGNGITSFLDD